MTMRKWLAVLMASYVLFSGTFTYAAVPKTEVSGDKLHLKAKAAVLMDANSGKILYVKNGKEALAPASMTKLMTLVLAMKAINSGKVAWSDQVPVSDEAYQMGGAQIWLEPGEQISLRQLLKAIAIGSANDACVAIAEYIGGSEEEFVNMMNQEAKVLGMENSNFANPHGLDEAGHAVSAVDMAKLARYAVTVPGLLKLTAMMEDRTIRNGKGGFLWLINHNRLLSSYKGMDGLKTGFTSKAGFCLTATAKRDGFRLISVVMGEPDAKTRTIETRTLLNYGFSQFSSVPIVKANHSMATVKVIQGIDASIPVSPAEDVYLTIQKGENRKISQKVELPDSVQAPIQKGQAIGRLIVYQSGEKIGEVPLIATASMDKLIGVKLFLHVLRGALHSA